MPPEWQRSALNRWVRPQLSAAPAGPGVDCLGPRCPLVSREGGSVPRSHGGCRKAGQSPLAWAGLAPASPLQQDLTVFAPEGAAVRPQAGNGSPFPRLRSHPLRSPDPDPGRGRLQITPSGQLRGRAGSHSYCCPGGRHWLLDSWILGSDQGRKAGTGLRFQPPAANAAFCGPGRVTPFSRGLPEAARMALCRVRRGGPGQCRRARNRGPGPEGDTAAAGRRLSQTAVRPRASPCRSPRSAMRGDPQTPGPRQPHLPGRGTRLISVSPPGLLGGSSPVNPEPLIPASPVGISLPGPFLRPPHRG